MVLQMTAAEVCIMQLRKDVTNRGKAARSGDEE